jgi:lipopolysaccharide/colanic/teichoic acid biosynthesis glycosyltransferase
MTDEIDAMGELLPDEVRLKKFGKFLRSTSLDELPEIINILKGEMSFVGPRPLLVEYMDLYTEEQKRRHDVRPGLTGLAQINGRNETTWEDRFKYDLEYVDNVSFKTDISIIFKTIKLVFTRKGVSGKNSATMEKFKGNLENIDKKED